MSESSKTYRIRTNVGEDNYVSVNLEQDYDVFDILSLKISSADVYRLHNSNYGVVVGRVLANNGFGIPNAKISIFIESDEDDGGEMLAIYPYKTTATKGESGVRYNLLPDEKVGDCHQVIGTFPNKRFVLDNEDIIEVFDKYYKYTTRTNGAGDYIIVGVPTGNQTLHMDLDLSDCGILSQRPRDFVYKGYTIEQFENPNMFKKSTELDSLSQVFSQDQSVFVQPFWGNESLGETIGITRADIDVAFKFEPTCVFIGCVASDNSSNGISKKCIPTPNMGNMDELTTGKGTIEMIRKTYAGSVEEFQIKGTELIDGDGIWCYQIPMNLDYMMTDEYGNMVPTDNPDKGIPTRTRVRFRISMEDMEENTDNYFRPKVLVPHNPQNLNGTSHENYDYDFGSNTKDESFRDLFWNNVYTVKSYIPRFQKRKVAGWKEKKFSGIKHVQDYGRNNPMPYNNIRIKLPFMFTVMCILIKIFIKIVSVVNTVISMLGNALADIGDSLRVLGYPFKSLYEQATRLKMNVIDEGLCPDLENWYFAPMFKNNLWAPSKKVPKGMKKYDLLKQTLDSITNDDDPESIDDQNQDDEDEAKCLTINTSYLISCIEMNLAQEYKVINFDFYNDWINGLIYIPRFMRYIRKKRKFLGITIVRQKVKGCMDDTKIFSKSRRYTQMCSLGFGRKSVNGHETYSKVTTNLKNKRQIKKSNNLHKKRGLTQEKIFGKNGGLVHEKTTMYGQFVYYLKPCEWTLKTTPLHRKINLFATDLVLLGSLNDCDMNGVPQAFRHLTSSSYIMPTNLALTNMEENGYLYAYGDNGTMCSMQNQTEEGTPIEKLSEPINRVDSIGETPLSSELHFYSGTSSNYDTEYNDPSDTIAITEAAGISWNYSGPGQGDINKWKLYYPGGHFLGLSCINSQTNIKSCINLERICELGTSMSQRKEDVRAVRNEDNESVLEYIYSVPTGLISGDDIIDDEFRTQFATMNKKRLIATKLNPETGYKVYDFMYSNPVNFSGELAKYTGIETPYNEPAVNVTDESHSLAEYGIEDSSNRDDYDRNEAYYSIKRTIEFPSIDYYMFRLGLDYKDVKKGSSRHYRQFAKAENGSMYLPQYENSFYFYFGTVDGSTALDEFNKQFFSQCETSVLSPREPNAFLLVEDFDLCTGTSNVTPYVDNLEAPLLIKIIDKRTNEEVYHGYFEDEDDIVTSALTVGDYLITVNDAEGSEVSAEFSVGKGILEGAFRAYDFNIVANWQQRPSDTFNMYYGGYILAEGVSVSGGAVSNLSIVAKRDNGQSETETQINSDGNTELYLPKSNVEYEVYVKYVCNGNTVELYAGTFTPLDTSTNYLTIGPVKKIQTDALPSYGMEPNWWNNYDDDHNGSEVDSWNIRKSILRPYKPGYATFSNSVESVGGLKSVFMQPQNSDGVHSVFMPEGDHEPIGYTVDDDASYYPTYGIPTADIHKQVNAASYNGVVVGGDFSAIVYPTQTGKIKSCTSVGTGRGLRNGEGVLFKPLPDGEIIPAIYQNGLIDCYCSKDEYEDAVEGIVYPTIIYPIVDRQFSVNANYFETMNKYLEDGYDEDGQEAAVMRRAISSGRCEASISGGVTYNRYFGGESYFTYVMGGEEDSEAESTRILVNSPDMYGVTLTSSPVRSMLLSGYSVSAADEVTYSLVEGYPLYTDNSRTFLSAFKSSEFPVKFSGSSYYAAFAETAELSLMTTFYDQFYYNKIDNTYIFFGEGSTDKTIKYYQIPLSETGGLIYEHNGRSINDYIAFKSGWWNWKEVDVLGRYTSKAKYDTEGKDVVVRITDDFGSVHAYIKFTQEDGGRRFVSEEKQTLSNFWSFDWGVNNANIEQEINRILDKYDNRVAFDHKREAKLDNAPISAFTEFVNRKCNEDNEIINLSHNCSSNKFVIIGVKKYTDPNGVSNGSRYMIYLYPTEIKRPADNVAGRIVDNEGNGIASLSFDSSQHSQTVQIACPAKSSVTATTDSPDWITIPSNAIYTNNNDSAQKYSFSVTVRANTSEYSRDGSIILKGKNSEGNDLADEILPIHQDGTPQQTQG